MTNPRTLLLSITATACGFILTLVGVAGPVPTAGVAAVATATALGFVSGVAQDTARLDHAPSGPDRPGERTSVWQRREVVDPGEPVSGGADS